MLTVMERSDRSLTPWYSGTEELFFIVILSSDIWKCLREWMYVRNSKKLRVSRYYAFTNSNMAVYHGYFGLIKEKFPILDMNAYDANAAAGYGHLNIVEFLHNNGLRCDQRAMYSAVRNNHVLVARFLYDRGIMPKYETWCKAIVNECYEANRFICSVNSINVSHMANKAKINQWNNRCIWYIETLNYSLQRPFLVQDAVICD